MRKFDQGPKQEGQKQKQQKHPELFVALQSIHFI
jgi:hypothetical protein